MRTLIARVYNTPVAILARLAWLLRSTGRWSRPVYTRVFDQYFRHFPVNGKVVFQEHYNMVRQLVPDDNLLEWNVHEGWGPLCKFLGHEVPDLPFPRTNDDQATGLMIRNLVRFEMRKAAWRCGCALFCFLWVVAFYVAFYGLTEGWSKRVNRSVIIV